MSDCKGVFGFLFGHRFRSRFSETSRVKSMDEFLPRSELSCVSFPIDFEDMALCLRETTKTYEGDVCIRCGATNKEEERR